jgi:geranylgeranyl pyrophosphate synthase
VLSAADGTLERLHARAERALRQVPLRGEPAQAGQRLIEAMRYSLLGGGKRLRPVLCLAAAEAVGGARAGESAVDCVCAAIECIHAYSLIHDDLPAMDDDDLRRGRPTCHRAFDEATAILAGDALHTLAFELLSSAQDIAPATRLELIATLAAASGSRGMVGGQAVDLASVGRPLAQAALEHMHALKTGALIRAAVRMGALLGEADAATHDALDTYARHIGLAFQVQDDILDATGTLEALGKQPGADAARAKPTFVSLLGAAAASTYAQQLCAAALAALDPLGERAGALAALGRFVVARER